MAQTPEPETLARAEQAALKALSPDGVWPVQERLGRFYDADSDYAGASFVALSPNDHDDIDAADVAGTSLLSVRIPPGAVRRLLDDGPVRDGVLKSLRDLPSSRLEDVDGDGFLAMEAFYLQVKGALSGSWVRQPNAWVTASKLCARKRPELFPVRDRDVCRLLELLSTGSYQQDWLVFAHLMRQERIMHELGGLPTLVTNSAQDRRLRLDTQPLRLLDAALWTQASMRQPASVLPASTSRP